MTFDRITFDPQVMGGQACIRGVRATAAIIVSHLAAGVTQERLLEAYPYLEPEDIQAALRYAAWRLSESELPAAAP